MWKILVALLAVAAIALFFLMQGDDRSDINDAQRSAPNAGQDTAPATAPATAAPAAPASESK